MNDSHEYGQQADDCLNGLLLGCLHGYSSYLNALLGCFLTLPRYLDVLPGCFVALPSYLSALSGCPVEEQG